MGTPVAAVGWWGRVHNPHLCPALIFRADGTVSECAQYVVHGGKHGLCYLHDKYAEGLTLPKEEYYTDEKPIYMTNPRTGAAWNLEASEGGERPEIEAISEAA